MVYVMGKLHRRLETAFEILFSSWIFFLYEKFAHRLLTYCGERNMSCIFKGVAHFWVVDFFLFLDLRGAKFPSLSVMFCIVTFRDFNIFTIGLKIWKDLDEIFLNLQENVFFDNSNKS